MTSWFGIGAAVLADGDRLASPDELCAAQTEVAPAPSGQLAGPAIERAVPALHRQDAPAIAGSQAAGLERTGERRVRRGLKRFVKWQRDIEGGQAVAEGLGGLQAGNAGEGHGAGLYIVYPAKRYDLFEGVTAIFDIVSGLGFLDGDRYTAWVCGRVAGTALVGLLLQPVAALVCETRCLTATTARRSRPNPAVISRPPRPAGSRRLVAARGDSCAHAEAAEPTSAPLPRASLAVLSTLGSQTTHVAVEARVAVARALHPPRHRAPDDSSGTLRV